MGFSVQQPTTSPTSSPQPTADRFEYWVKVIIGFCILIIAFDLSFIALSKLFVSKNTSQSQTPIPKTPATVSGNIDVNGVLPKEAIIEIQERLMGDSTFTIATTIPLAVDGASWDWTTAENGTTYELKAVAKSNGKVIAESMTLAVTAPAVNETLRIVSTAVASAQDLSDPIKQSVFSSISGKIDLNGYIPPNASLTIQVKKSGEGSFTPIANGLNASDGISWSWDKAESGVTYEFQAILLTGNATIGTSPTLSTAAPAHDETLVINSKATGPNTQNSISGTYNVNGPIPNGTTITLSMRKSGTNQFNPAQANISPIDGSSWNISNLQSGVSYDILAYLQGNNQTYAQSQLLVVTAPAQGEKLTFNIASKPNAPPSSSITFNCAGKNNNNQWQVNVQYNQNNVNPSAKAFILQLGSNSGSSDIFSIQTAPNNPTQMQTYSSNFMLNEGQTYFAQYAYSTCQACTDQSFYSQFAGPIQVRCTTNPTGTPTPQPTNTPIPTTPPVPTSTNTPTPSPVPTNSPTPTPKISQCNESCGGSGFQCADNLTCILPEEGGLGSNVCRNPSCTEKPNCSCE